MNLPIHTPLITDTFKTWFDRHGFRHFKADEFTSYFEVERRGVRNSPPPRELWMNIVPALRIVDQLREDIRRPVIILSSYRSPGYNKAIDGAATQSHHMKFQALDIAVSGHMPQEVHRRLSLMRGAGDFKGGLGLYNTFVHIDTRGHNASW